MATTAKLSVGIDTSPAKAHLKALHDEMKGVGGVKLPVTLDTKGLSSLKVSVDAASLKTLSTQISKAVQDGLSGIKLGGANIKQLESDIKLIKQRIATAASDVNIGEKIADSVKKGAPKAAAAAKEAGKQAGKAFAEGESEGAKLAKISYRFREGAGSVSISDGIRYTVAEVKAKAESVEADKRALQLQKEKNQQTLRYIDNLVAVANLKKKEELAAAKAAAEQSRLLSSALTASNATRLDPRTLLGLPSRDEMKGIGASLAAQFREGAKLDVMRASAASKVDPRTLLGLPSRDEMKGIGASIAAQFREGVLLETQRASSNRSRVDAASLLGISQSNKSAKASASVFLASEAAVMGPSGAELVAMKAKYEALQATKKATDEVGKAAKQSGESHLTATKHTQTHAAAMRDAHSAARGLASGFGAMWLTWGNIAPLLAGAALSHGLIQAVKAGTELAYQLKFVQALGGETADAVGKIGTAALELSKNSLYGPVELANGLRTLSQAGLSAAESMKALPVVIDLATVGEMNMKDAAITLVGVMTAFNLDKTDFSRIGDVFAKAAAVSQTSVEQMTQAMKTASVVGEQYGAKMEDTATALTLLAKVNITGTAAGTSLRNMLKELYSPTQKAAEVMKTLKVEAQGANGELKPFPDVIFAMQKSLEKYNKASQVKLLQAMFGERGAKEAIAMLSLTRKEWDELNNTISKSEGFMRDVSSALEGTVKGSFKQAINTLQASLIEAYNTTEGAAGQLAGKLKETFGSAEFKETLSAMVSGMLSLTNALVAMAPALAVAAAGWLALKAAMIGQAAWTAAAAALSGATLAAQTFGAVAAGTATTLTGSTGLLAAVRLLPGLGAAAGASILATTGVLGPLAVAIGAAGAAWYLFRDRTVEAMDQSTSKVKSSTAEMIGDLARFNSEVGKLSAVSVRGKADAAFSAVNSTWEEVSKERKEAAKRFGVDPRDLAGDFDVASVANKATGSKFNIYGALGALREKNLEAAKQRDAALGLLALAKKTEDDDAKIAKSTLSGPNSGSLNWSGGGGGGGGASKEAGKLESAVVKNMIKEFSDKERLTDVHYNNLIKKENAFAEAGLKTREGAENKIAEITEEHATKRLELSDQYLASIKELMKNSGNMTESQREQLKGELDHRVRLIEQLQEELKWKKELAEIKSAGAEAKFVRDVEENKTTLDKEAALRRQKVMGPAQSPLDRARAEGELLAESRFAQLRTDLEYKVKIAREGSDAAAIASAENRRDRLIEIIEEEKRRQGELFVELAEYQQTAAYGWKTFWEKYQEEGTTAAKVVEQSLTSVTSHLEDAFAEFFKTGAVDFRKLADSILADMGRLTAKMVVSDLSGLLFGKKKGADGAEGTKGVLDDAVTAIKGFWNSLTGATTATDGLTGSTTKTVAVSAQQLFGMTTKTTAEQAATASLTALAAAANSAATAMAAGAAGGGGGINYGSLISAGFNLVTGNYAGAALSLVGGVAGKGGPQSSSELAIAKDINSAGLGEFAKGGVLNTADLSAYSNTIVTRPTLFAKGGNLMGEAGPEAIMPLGRDSQGRLGVRYQPMQEGLQSSRQSETPQPPPQNNIRIINAFDTGVIGDYLGSSEGEKLVMNVVRRNQTTMKRMVTA